ncbi:MAG: M20 family peptidase [Sarcina ventriculi]|uniref:Peptidase M20 domain-containing protein 2 n=1 Tax=Sarcina ventriculi TaxID=1267 RepID=A0ABP2AU63_SARVE|nr:hypothetical protein [Sarcina ventriculi]MBU5323270.1 M20 family peptidase [Sarcina ventriculi]MCI5637574.1 M20 family peptidase [Sarcina ventriculi]MDD7373843.1 M20 family peptidase [Sarcina ventriculi]MDY7063421.1 M20 family peptidase [Sarcina ventriculi]CUO21112.1 Aminobenzoyl-glutamate utilization protein B [Sarcina ventriculi]
MKQEILSYLSTEKENLFKLCKFLYDNPEESYKEYESCKYICDFLNTRGFNITKNFCDIETAFIATKGSGYPNICFLCDYDATKDQGHITGNNLLTTISISSAIGLGKFTDKFTGTITVIGSPGEFLGGSKSIFAKLGVFDNIDAVLMVQPELVTAESGLSKATIPLEVKFIGGNGLSFLNSKTYTSLDGILLSFNILNSLLKALTPDISINFILSRGCNTPLLVPEEAEAKFYIQAKNMDMAKFAEERIRELTLYVSKLMGLQCSYSLYEPPSEELLSNKTLNRLFINNLKENGVIEICPPLHIESRLSIGNISTIVPCIHPYINIIEKGVIYFGTKEFAEQTISSFGFEQGLKASYALAQTALDLIENDSLLNEAKSSLY